MIAFSLRRWLIVILALLLTSSFYFIGYRKVSLEDVQRGMHYPNYPADREPEQASGFAWYDYLRNPPTDKVQVEIPEGVTKRPPEPGPKSEPEAKLTQEQKEKEEQKKQKEEQSNKAKIPPAQPFPIPAFITGDPKLAPSEYSRMLVLLARKDDNTDWVQGARAADPLLGSTIYTLNDEKAAHPAPYGPSSVYLQYIIDHYDSLRDITLFMYAQQNAWQLDHLLNNSANAVLTLMDRRKIITDGFMSLRCTLSPGCPAEEGIFVNMHDEYADREEDVAMNAVWKDFFGTQQPPKRLAEPAYSQYALSRERIRAIPKSQYVYMLKRLGASAVGEEDLKKFWSHAWHYLWTGEEARCTAEDVCFCENYSVCFKNTAEYTTYAQDQRDLVEREAVVLATRITGNAEQDAARNDKLKEIFELKKKMYARLAEAQARGAKKKENSMSAKLSAGLESLDAHFDKTVDSATDGVKGLWDAVKEFAGTEEGKKVLETGSDEGHETPEEQKPAPKEGYSPGAERRKRIRGLGSWWRY